MIGKLIDQLWKQPARVVAISFVGVAFVGAVVLLLPVSRTGPTPLAPIDALFTAVSAVCVTGLIVVDTPVFFSGFGEAVILLLIQIGGLGIMAFSLSAIFLTRKRLSVGESELLSLMLNEEDRTSLRGQLLRVLLFTFSIEALGALLLLPSMTSENHSSVWLAVFHSVSAFCNAGFSLYSDSMERFADNVGVNATISGLIILGGIGFATLTVIYSDIVSIVERFRRSTGTASRRFLRPTASVYLRSESSRIALRGSLLLLLVGAVVFYLIEGPRSLSGANVGHKYLVSIFQSVTFRTAGFNTIGIAGLHRATLLVALPFMFIGASSGGTAGGIKIGTVAVIWADMKRFVLGKNDAVLFFRRIPRRTIVQAYVLFVAGITTVFVAMLVMSISESAPLETVLFEVVSALGTVGLSAGLTGELSSVGKIVIIFLMLLGRLGPLTLFLAFRPQTSDVSVRYPDATLPIG